MQHKDVSIQVTSWQNQVQISEFVPEVALFECFAVGEFQVGAPGYCFQHGQVRGERLMQAGEQAIDGAYTALGSDDGLGFSAEQLFQGPIADSFTHVGQIAMLRRLASAPIKGEDYSRADIAAGRVSQAQHIPKVEF